MSALFEKDERGVERCQRIKEGAVENVKGNPAAGHHRAKILCNRPAALSISEGRKFCPDCDKPVPVGNVNPRTISANDTALTPKEMQECGLNPDGTRIDGKPVVTAAPTKAIEAPQAVEAKVEVKKDEVIISVPLKDLEANEDVAAYLIRKVIDGFGELPVSNFKESKRLIQLEEKLSAMLGA